MVSELVGHFAMSVRIRLAICIIECVLLDILVGHLREMHGKWSPVILNSMEDCTTIQ